MRAFSNLVSKALRQPSSEGLRPAMDACLAAASAGDLPAFTRVMESYPKRGIPEASRLFPFERACQAPKNGPQMMQLLISKGFPCPSSGIGHFTPINLALAHGNWDTATLTLQRLSLDSSAELPWGDPRKHAYVARLMSAMDRGARISGRDQEKAAIAGRVLNPDYQAIAGFFFVGARMLKKAFGQNESTRSLNTAAQQQLSSPSSGSETPIICLAALSDAALQALLYEGADPNPTDASGQSALHIAAKYGRLESVKALIAKGALTDSPDKSGNTPARLAWLHRGAIRERLDQEVDAPRAIMRALFNAGASASRVDADGLNWQSRTALALDIDGLEIALSASPIELDNGVAPQLAQLISSSDPLACDKSTRAAQAIYLIARRAPELVEPALLSASRRLLPQGWSGEPGSPPDPNPTPPAAIGDAAAAPSIKRRIGARR